MMPLIFITFFSCEITPLANLLQITHHPVYSFRCISFRKLHFQKTLYITTPFTKRPPSTNRPHHQRTILSPDDGRFRPALLFVSSGMQIRSIGTCHLLALYCSIIWDKWKATSYGCTARDSDTSRFWSSASYAVPHTWAAFHVLPFPFAYYARAMLEIRAISRVDPVSRESVAATPFNARPRHASWSRANFETVGRVAP